MSGAALYVPRACVDLSKWCGWMNNNPRKIDAVVGRSFRTFRRTDGFARLAEEMSLGADLMMGTPGACGPLQADGESCMFFFDCQSGDCDEGICRAAGNDCVIP